MLDFLLVLGQVPGTHITLTFNEMLTIYFVIIACYIYRHDHKIASSTKKFIELSFWLYISRNKLGRPYKTFKNAIASELQPVSPSDLYTISTRYSHIFTFQLWKNSAPKITYLA
jgi:hypothetical protein